MRSIVNSHGKCRRRCHDWRDPSEAESTWRIEQEYESMESEEGRHDETLHECSKDTKFDRLHFQRKRSRRSSMSLAWRLCATSLLLVLCSCPTTFMIVSASTVHPEYLDENSVVLITGAAGFIGSELAMALHRTYDVKKILCIDSMDSDFGMAARSQADNIEGKTKSSRSEEEFALFEFKRQRAFHILQTLGTKAHFYRADFRPSIPDFYDMGEVPILDYIFKDHPDISHVVHLADPYHSGAMDTSARGDILTQAVPRIKEQTKTGMIEVLLEQLKLVSERTGRIPQFTYASSYEVYNHLHANQEHNPNPPPFREDLPITTPSSLRGASKLIDEVLTEAYHSMHGIYSVGLRFFPVYGPWGLPGSPLFAMAERAVSDPGAPIMSEEEEAYSGDVRDFVYIDDAVDAIMSAMQFRPQESHIPPVVINVGTGKGITLKEVARRIAAYLPRSEPAPQMGSRAKPTISYASTDRAEQLLGFKARVLLDEGLLKLLSWHYDRVFPYGGRIISAENDKSGSSHIASKGIASCSPFDKECLRGAPIFPCASECSHEVLCTTSMYDDVTAFTRSLTAECQTVMYTVALSKDLTEIPSANIPTEAKSQSFVPDTEKSSCNIAFVSERSALVRESKEEHGMSTSKLFVEEYAKVARPKKFKSKLLKHGSWTLVPVLTPSFTVGDEHISRLLPKLSPGIFFGPNTKYAIYCDPNVLFTSVPALLEEAKMQPYQEGSDGATAVLLPSRSAPTSKFVWEPAEERGKASDTAEAEYVQSAAYRMIRIGVIDETVGDESLPLVDSSWLVHILRNEDTRLLRCDIFGEVVQWDVGSDIPGLEFIMGLHDMWSRAIIQWAGNEPWWIGDGVITVPQGSNAAQGRKSRRRLEEAVEDPAAYKDGEYRDGNAPDDMDQGADDADKAYAEERMEREVEGDEGNGDNADPKEEVPGSGDTGDENEEIQADDADGNADTDERQDADEGGASEKDGEQDGDSSVEDLNQEVHADDEANNGYAEEQLEREAEGEPDNPEEEKPDEAQGDLEEDAEEEPDEAQGDLEGDAEEKPDEAQGDLEEDAAEKVGEGDEVGEYPASGDAAGEEGGIPGNLEKGGDIAGDKVLAGVDVEKVIGDAKVPGGEDGEAKDSNDAFGENKAKQDTNGNGEVDGELDSPEAGEEAAVAAKQVDVPDKSSPEDDDEAADTDGDADGEEDKAQAFGAGAFVRAPDRDVSAYDTWMGVLSSTDTHFFIRIIPSSEVGVIFLDDNDSDGGKATK